MKNIFLALAFTCLATAAFAQFHIGLSAGPNLSFWKWEINSIGYNIDYEPAMGLRTVVLGEWQMSPFLGLRAEVGAQVKANKITRNLLFESDLLAGNFNGTPWTFREYYQYWEGSLLVQVSPLKKMRGLYLLAGGSGGRLESAWTKSSGSEGGKKSSSKNSVDVQDPQWNRTALAADWGIGGNIPLDAHSSIKIEGRFQYSLSNLARADDVDARVNPLFLTLGYLHRL